MVVLFVLLTLVQSVLSRAKSTGMERVLIVVEMVPRLRIVGVARLRRASYVAGIVRRRGLRLAFQVPALFLEVPDDTRNRLNFPRPRPAGVH